MSKLVKYGFGLMYLGLSFAAHSANFDCSKATQKVEKMICSDIELSAMDSDIYSAQNNSSSQNVIKRMKGSALGSCSANCSGCAKRS